MDLLRESIRTFLKLSPLPNPPAIHIVNEAEGDGFRRSLIRYSAHDGEQIEAFLLEPKIAEPRGAVLALHQHNSQWAIGKSEVAGLMGDPLQAFGPALARRGITVLAPDSIGFESRMKRQAGERRWRPRSVNPTARKRVGYSTTIMWLIVWCVGNC